MVLHELDEVAVGVLEHELVRSVRRLPEGLGDLRDGVDRLALGGQAGEARGVAAGKVFQPIRIALTGGTVSEPVNELLYVVGKEAALERLKTAISRSSPGREPGPFQGANNGSSREKARCAE